MLVHVRTENSSWEAQAKLVVHALVAGPSASELTGMTEIRKMYAGAAGSHRPEDLLELCGRALDALAEGVFVTDRSLPDNPIVYVNQVFEQMTGYGSGELIGRSYASFRGPDSDPRAFVELEAALREKRAWAGDMLTYRKDGSTAWHDVRLVHVLDAAGSQYSIGVQADITERKNLQERFRQVEKMAALGFLAAGIAHDFNNMLTGILAYSDILLGSPVALEVRHGLEKIKEAGERAATLTSQLLAFSRKQQPKTRPVDLRSVVLGMNSLLRLLIGERIELVTVIEPTLEPIELVPGQVEQMLLNLVVNSRDAMPDGGAISVELASSRPDVSRARGPGTVRPGQYVMLAVTDTGCGMSADLLAELFRPLFTTKREGQGTGLGLFTVHEIVKQNNGLIAVTSQPGRGTRVEIFLPRDEISAHEASSTAAGGKA
jgi:PAS domain S-box-containing protein